MSVEIAYNQLVEQLEQEVTLYRTMLDIVRREHDILVEAKLEDLVENNKTKEMLVAKIRAADRVREKRARDLGIILNCKSEPLRLLDLASQLEFKKGDKLRSIHTTLDLLVKRIKEHNEKNEELVGSALKNIQGALESLKHSLEGKETYKQEGQIQKTAAPTGRFVSKEA